MKQEEKRINWLLKDLCGRLPYKVKVKYYDSEDERDSVDVIEGCEGMDTNNPRFYIGQYSLSVDEIKPYLFPLSSMTDKQHKEYSKTLIYSKKDECFHTTIDSFEWFNANHFDCRNLIGKKLAIDCTNLNIY